MRDDFAFRAACENGHLETAKWLHEAGLGIDIHRFNNLAFRGACVFGHLETAQWLVRIGVDGRAYDDVAFQEACYSGRLHVAKWLVKDVGVDAYTCGAHAFLMTVTNGVSAQTAKRPFEKFFEVARWLIAIAPRINVHQNGDSAFRACVMNGPTRDMARWIMSLDPEWAWPQREVNLLMWFSSARQAWVASVVRSSYRS